MVCSFPQDSSNCIHRICYRHSVKCPEDLVRSDFYKCASDIVAGFEDSPDVVPVPNISKHPSDTLNKGDDYQPQKYFSSIVG